MLPTRASRQRPASLVTLALLLVPLVTPTIAAPATAPQHDRPNILLCIADDWSWPHAGAYGDPVIKTPTFDRVAADGVLFTHSFCAAPTCSASRAALLTGQMPHRLEEGANLWGFLPPKFKTYPDQLEAAGYVVGHQGKAWGPGSLGERKRNPGGPKFKSFDAFLATVPDGKPFCFWFGSADPHRPYAEGSGEFAGMKPGDVRVPPWLPDTPEVRSDILDYGFEVQRFDHDVGEILARLASSGRADNTLVVITSDNGMPFPRAKANLYDSGTHMPLAIRWPKRVKAGRKVEAFVSHTDLSPTFLEATGVEPLAGTTGRSILGLLTGDGGDAASAGRDRVFVERERHANVRKGDLSYPARAIRTETFCFVRNFEPDRYPAGDPEMWKAVGPFGDIDGGPTKSLLLQRRDDAAIAPFFRFACAKRPGEELFDLAKDPDQVHNLAGSPDYAEVQAKLRAELQDWMKQTADPRAEQPHYDGFDRYPYFGGPGEPTTKPARAKAATRAG